LDQVLKDKWIEIDMDAVSNNLKEVRTRLPEKVKLIAVVKANAYGHGAVEIARLLVQQGVDYFAVSFLHEALQLRRAGIRAGILVFSPIVNVEEMREAISNNITITLASGHDGELLREAMVPLHKQAIVHLKVDTGLGRFGLNGAETQELLRTITADNNILVEGIYTHMADAAGSASYTEKQFAIFKEIIDSLGHRGQDIPIKHCANSSVFLKFPHMHMNAVRIGTLLSGQHPAGHFDHPLNLQDPYKFKTRLISLRVLPGGSYLGYYRSYRLGKDAQIGVIPVGFNDGLALGVANKPAGFIDMIKVITKIVLGYFNFSRFNLQVRIKDQTYPVRGKVFMQMALIEIPVGAQVNVGDEVEVPVRKTLASQNIVRVYMKDGLPGKISWDEGTSYIVDSGQKEITLD
jgi:alanine racemase